MVIIGDNWWWLAIIGNDVGNNFGLFLTHIEELTVFAFSDNLSAENSKFSADSGSQRNQLLECMP